LYRRKNLFLFLLFFTVIFSLRCTYLLPVTDVITAVLFTLSIQEGKRRLAAADDSYVFLKFLVGIVYYFYADSVCRAFVIVLGKRIETAFGYGELPVDLLN
jgi:hypothetical protein